MDDHAAMIAKLNGDLSSWSINVQTQAHREEAPPLSSPNLSDDSASDRSVKPTGASESSSSGSPSERGTRDEDATLFELEEDQEDEVVDDAAQEAAQFVRGLLPASGTYSDRQRCAHGLATALGASANAATVLTAHLDNTTLMRSLLRLIDDAQHKSDALTADIVLGPPPRQIEPSHSTPPPVDAEVSPLLPTARSLPDQPERRGEWVRLGTRDARACGSGGAPGERPRQPRGVYIALRHRLFAQPQAPAGRGGGAEAGGRRGEATTAWEGGGHHRGVRARRAGGAAAGLVPHAAWRAPRLGSTESQLERGISRQDGAARRQLWPSPAVARGRDKRCDVWPHGGE